MYIKKRKYLPHAKPHNSVSIVSICNTAGQYYWINITVSAEFTKTESRTRGSGWECGAREGGVYSYEYSSEGGVSHTNICPKK